METELKGNFGLLSDNAKENMDVEFSKSEDICEETRQTHEKKPPDGGLLAYSVVAGSFVTNGLLFSVINSYSVIYDVLEKQLQNEANSSSRASLVGALAMGTTFFLSPLSGLLTEFLGIRLTAILGGTVAALGLLLSSFIVEYVDALNFSYGIMYGLGAALAYTPSLAILGHYFKKYLGIVNGIVCIGSPVFTVVMAPFMDYLIRNHGLDWMFRILAVWTFGVALCGFLFKPISANVIEKKSEKKSGNNKMIIQIWKNKKYRLWALCMPIALFGYFVPYVHLKKFIDTNFKDVNYNLPLQCISIGSGIGRISFGFLADRPGVDKILLQQISFYVIGTFTIILPFMGEFWMVVLVALGMGLCDGAFISLIGPIAIEICGSAYAAQAIGCMLGMAATPLCLGPPIAGYLYNVFDSYTLPFVLAGISPIAGATFMFLIRLHRGRRSSQKYERPSALS